MRLFGILLVSMTPLLLAVDYRVNQKKRLDFLSRFLELIDFVSEQIRFCGRDRDEIFLLALGDARFKSPLFGELFNAVKYGENIAKIINESNDIRLNIQEKEGVCDFLANLGRSDISGQVERCGRYRTKLFGLYEKDQAEFRLKGRLYLGLSLLLGAALFILML